MPEAKRRLAMAMAEHLAMALSNLRLHETLRNQSIRDQTTGSSTGASWKNPWSWNCAAQDEPESLSMIMLALDDFRN